MEESTNKIIAFAESDFRNKSQRFGIKEDDRRRHMYIIGKTGMGKTNLLETMIIQDIQAGHGVAFVDPHGETAEEILHFVPESRLKDVIYVNPGDLDYPIAFNVMEKVKPEHRHLVASGLMGIFKKLWPDVWSARMEYILNNAILSLLEYPDSTLLGINRMLSDKEFRKQVVDKITDSVVKSFWQVEFAKYTQRLESEATAAIQNKVGQFISNPLVRNIIGQTHSSFDIRKIMDEGKILIINTSKGRVGEDNSRLLGAMLITKIQLAAMSRVDVPESERRDFYLYVDEFQNFATEAFANILSEARKYRLSLILAHQYIAQLVEKGEKGVLTKVRDAVFGNVGTLISFRVGAEDAEFLEKEFSPVFMASDLVNLPKFHIALKLMIDGITSRAFSARTLPPSNIPSTTNRDKIVAWTREHFATKREVVEEKIAKTQVSVLPERPSQAPHFESERPKRFEFEPRPFRRPEPRQDETPRKKGFITRPVISDDSKLSGFEVKCDRCNKATLVSFKPDGKRPVYCKDCLEIVRGEHQEFQKRKREVLIRPVKIQARQKVIETPPAISLKEAVDKHYVTQGSRRSEVETRKRDLDIAGLRKVLSEVKPKEVEIENIDPPAGGAADGKENILKPGESIKFD